MKQILAFLTASLLLILNSGCAAELPQTNEEKNAPQVHQALQTHPKEAKSGFAALRVSNGQRKKKQKSSEGIFSTLSEKYNLVEVPTYDGSGQLTHPKMLYFPQGWNGWKYWMSYTPYPNGNADYENPSLAVSNDMVHWNTPGTLKNPVTGIPADVRYGGHYSDSHIVMRGSVMELWYRYDKGNRKTDRPDYSMDYYYRMTSSDGVHWSQPELMQCSKGGILSLAVNYEDGQYEFWYTDYRHRLLHTTSVSGKDWKQPCVCSLTLPGNYAPWHQDIVRYNGEYYLLQTGINLSRYSFSLFLSHSSDGTHFSAGVPFYPSDDPMILSRAWLYRSTLVEENNSFIFMIAVRFPDGRWYLMKSDLSVQKFLQAQKSVILEQIPSKSGVQSA